MSTSSYAVVCSSSSTVTVLAPETGALVGAKDPSEDAGVGAGVRPTGSVAAGVGAGVLFCPGGTPTEGPGVGAGVAAS